jgi:hypothetical protein
MREKCSCGSFAVNKDPARIKCDACYNYDLGVLAGRESMKTEVVAKIVKTNIAGNGFKTKWAIYDAIKTLE